MEGQELATAALEGRQVGVKSADVVWVLRSGGGEVLASQSLRVEFRVVDDVFEPFCGKERHLAGKVCAEACGLGTGLEARVQEGSVVTIEWFVQSAGFSSLSAIETVGGVCCLFCANQTLELRMTEIGILDDAVTWWSVKRTGLLGIARVIPVNCAI